MAKNWPFPLQKLHFGGYFALFWDSGSTKIGEIPQEMPEIGQKLRFWPPDWQFSIENWQLGGRNRRFRPKFREKVVEKQVFRHFSGFWTSVLNPPKVCQIPQNGVLGRPFLFWPPEGGSKEEGFASKLHNITHRVIRWSFPIVKPRTPRVRYDLVDVSNNCAIVIATW